MSTSAFPRFRNLPPELRQKIWSLCVPDRRVHEMDFPLSENHATFPAGVARPRELWSSPSGRIPVISHVCREARNVALKRHQYVVDEELHTDEDGASYPPWTAWNINLPIRFRKGIDIVHLHWHRAYDRHDWFPTPPCPLPSFQWLANQAAAASVSADLLHPFDPDYDNPYSVTTTIGSKDIKYFSPSVLYYVVLAIVEIHMSEGEAAQARVFGALGEEPIQLVDPRDTATVAKFRNVWRCRQSPSEEPDVAEFFSRTTDAADAYCARVEQWRQDLEKVWIWHKCVELGVSHDTRAEIWPARNRPAGLTFPSSLRQRIDWSQREVNREHSWVQTQLDLMPRFEPALMFRHCIGMCGLAGHANP